jgi:hypothetical protein
VTTLQDECTGVLWELNMARNFFLGGLLSLGELRGVAGHLPGLLQTAEERGNFYLEIELRTRMILVWLAADDAEGAARRADEAIARWSHRGFQRQHYNHLLTRVQTDLYRGRARDAWERMARHEAPIRQSLFLRVQHTRIESANYHARCALAMAGSGYDASRMRGIALRDASRIRREDMPWSNPFVRLIQGTVAHQEGDATAAIARLSAALEGFDTAGMRLYAAACRRRLGQILGGDAGRALVDEADRWLAAQEVRDADAMTRLIAPGFLD